MKYNASSRHKASQSILSRIFKNEMYFIDKLNSVGLKLSPCLTSRFAKNGVLIILLFLQEDKGL